MNWQLLGMLAAAYTVVYFVMRELLVAPGFRYLRARFEQEFGRSCNELNLAWLTKEESLRWDEISRREWETTRYRTMEMWYACFHYPSIIILSAILRRRTMSSKAMFFVTGAVYVAIAYLLVRKQFEA